MAPRCFKMPEDTHLGPKDVDISKNHRFPIVFVRFKINIGPNLPGNETENAVVWIALAIDGMLHASAIILFAVAFLFQRSGR